MKINHRGTFLKVGKNCKVIDCKTCEFIHLQPIPPPEELKEAYSDKYYKIQKPQYLKRDEEDKLWWKTVFQDRMDFVERYSKKKKGRLLEIGSGPGSFLTFARSRGWSVLGIEPSIKAYKHSKLKRLRVINSFYQDIDLKSLTKFDAVVMFELLEHVPDPHELLKFSCKSLRHNGVICIAVPNDFNPLQDIANKIQRNNPYWIAPPFHINYFTPASLTNLLKRSGFDVIRTETNFPMEMFLMMGDNYVGHDKIGRGLHAKRKNFDLAFSKFNNNLKLSFYESLSKLGIGRDLTIYAKKT